MRRSLRVMSVSVVMVLAACVTAARAADEKADALKAKVVEAYKNTKQMQSTVTVAIHQKEGRWTSDKSTDVLIGFDRDAKRLSVDKAELLVVIEGGKAKLKSDQVPGSYAEFDYASGLIHDDLKKAVPFLLRPPLPELVFLTAADPLTTLNEKDCMRRATANSRPTGDVRGTPHTIDWTKPRGGAPGMGIEWNRRP
ncbi:MAG: hypothetical protein K8S99_12885, partial [Planctomycetes bacterium]|nr:hypothetical protein [Planctomycetota bacterium]